MTSANVFVTETSNLISIFEIFQTPPTPKMASAASDASVSTLLLDGRETPLDSGMNVITTAYNSGDLDAAVSHSDIVISQALSLYPAAVEILENEIKTSKNVSDCEDTITAYNRMISSISWLEYNTLLLNGGWCPRTKLETPIYMGGFCPGPDSCGLKHDNLPKKANTDFLRLQVYSPNALMTMINPKALKEDKATLTIAKSQMVKTNTAAGDKDFVNAALTFVNKVKTLLQVSTLLSAKVVVNTDKLAKASKVNAKGVESLKNKRDTMQKAYNALFKEKCPKK